MDLITAVTYELVAGAVCPGGPRRGVRPFVFAWVCRVGYQCGKMLCWDWRYWAYTWWKVHSFMYDSRCMTRAARGRGLLAICRGAAVIS